MSPTGVDEKVAEFGFGFRLDEEDKFNKVDVEKRPDRFRMGYHEVCLEGYKIRPLWNLSVSLDEHDYRRVDADATGFTYYSPDRKTEVYLDEVLDVEDEVCRIMILRGELMEDGLLMAEQEVRDLFCNL